MQEVILIVCIIAYSPFMAQFLASLFGYDTDLDLDLDFDGDADLSLSDLVSFKGLIHFLMGSTSCLCSTLHYKGFLTIFDWIIAAVVGVIFVVGLYYLYRLCLRLQHIPTKEKGDLGERYVEILRHEREFTYIGAATINGAYDHFTVESTYPLTVGSQYKITKFINNKIYI